MQKDGQIDIKDIREKLSMDSKTFGVYRDRLIKKGVIISDSYGKVEFSLPRFDKFLQFKG